MFCPKCGKETDASGKFCQWCGADIESSAPVKPVGAAPVEEEGPEIGVYAGLGRRFIAWIVDTILILLIGIVVIAFFSMANGIKYAYYIVVQHAPVSQLTEAGTPDAAFTPIIAAFGMLVIIVPWLYYASFESSRSQATPGKLLMKMVVTDLDGNKPTFARVTLRHFAKFISALIICIGFLMIGLTQKKQGLHDKISGCLVLLQQE
ncbi:MAG TPA: RDD family protein [Methanoregula sp.]|nr:RDD family protein [Methanoregula sp.]